MVSDDTTDNVIHVRFGPGARRRTGAPPAARGADAEGSDAAPRASAPGVPLPCDAAVGALGASRPDPVSGLYTAAEAARLLGLKPSRLRYWARTRFIAPSGGLPGRRRYTFEDLISLRAAKGLLDLGVPLRRMRAPVEALRASLPTLARPVTELRVTQRAGALVVTDEAGTFDPVTGQALLDFRIDALTEAVVRTLHPHPTDAQRRAAYGHYLEGCRLDEDETTQELAVAAYERAIALDPGLSNALTNLGNLSYRRDDVDTAVRWYERALAADPLQPEAMYNLGFVALEAGRWRSAAERFEQTVAIDPGFADAHFNLATAYERLGERARARPHWSAYLDLEPTGPLADHARAQLRS